MNSLRPLWMANAPFVASGYGQPTAALAPRLADLPEVGGRRNFAIFAFHGTDNAIIDHDGFRIYPKYRHRYGCDIIGFHAKDFGANWVVTFIDTWVMEEVAQSVAPALWTPYLPIDMTPVPKKVLEGMAGCYLPLVFSKWGRQELANAGVEAMYIPLGVEPRHYRILPDDEVRRVRQTAFKDPAHLTVMVAANKANPARKNFDGQFRAWAEFAKDKPGARLYIHTDPSPFGGGIDLRALANDLGILDRCMWPQWYRYAMSGYTPDDLALLYNAADIFLGAAMGEGFGIPIVEAEACGTPVIVTDFSSMPELVRWGHAVAAAEMFYTPLEAYQVIPSTAAITEALNLFYADWEANGRQKDYDSRKNTQDAIHAEYGWDVIVRDYWQPLAQRMAQECPELDERYRTPVKRFLGPQSVPEPNGLHKLGVLNVEAQA